MSRFLWKMAGGLLPFTGAVYAGYHHPHYTIPVLALAVIWANAVGFIEGHLRSIGR
jgi:hypothetical protein